MNNNFEISCGVVFAPQETKKEDAEAIEKLYQAFGLKDDNEHD